MDQFLSKYQFGFRKGYSTQYCLLAMLEKWKSVVDKVKSFGALLTDLSKAFSRTSACKTSCLWIYHCGIKADS